MAHKEIELILARQLADSLGVPMLLVDAEGTLVFFNEPAEKIIGHRFDETGAIPAERWRELFELTDGQGHALKAEERPSTRALNQHEASHATLWIRGADRLERRIGATALPLIGRGGRFLGALIIFWETEGE